MRIFSSFEKPASFKGEFNRSQKPYGALWLTCGLLKESNLDFKIFMRANSVKCCDLLLTEISEVFIRKDQKHFFTFKKNNKIVPNCDFRLLTEIVAH